jgi:ATP-binding cassette subfamily B protein
MVIWGLKGVVTHIGNLVTYRNLLYGFLPSFEQVKQLTEEAHLWVAPSGKQKFTKLNHSIVFQKLSFTYPGRDITLNQVNLCIHRGKFVAIVGSSGSGKSTLVDLLLGLNVHDQGQVLVDDIPLQQYELDSFRNRVGYVPQDAVLFHMSIRDNLLWANAEATEKDLWEACSQANATEFVEKLPEQLETVIGDRGVRLSGGQCQRLALARALVRKPELLILDEATSALDSHSEHLIQQAINEISGEITIVVVAHRLSTITNADYVYVMNEGKVAEEGKYIELLKHKGLFYKMVKAQQLQASE